MRMRGTFMMIRARKKYRYNLNRFSFKEQLFKKSNRKYESTEIE
jgi:hypothetical protein